MKRDSWVERRKAIWLVLKQGINLDPRYARHPIAVSDRCLRTFHGKETETMTRSNTDNAEPVEYQTQLPVQDEFPASIVLVVVNVGPFLS